MAEKSAQSYNLDMDAALKSKEPQTNTNNYEALTIKEVETYKGMGLTNDNIRVANEMAKSKLDEMKQKLCISPLDRAPQDKGRIINLLLLGRPGSGKSATGNLILGRNEFVESMQSTSCTKTIQLAECDVDDIHIKVIDSPSFFGVNVTPQDVHTEIAKVLNYHRDGIHGILLVFNLGNPRFTEEEWQAFQGGLGKKFHDHCFVVLTHGSEIVKRGSLQDFIHHESQNKSDIGHPVNSIVKSRVIAVNNNEHTSYGRRLQQEQIVRMVAAHSTSSYTPNVLKEFAKRQRTVTDKIHKDCHPYIEVMECSVAELTINMPWGQILKLSEQVEEKKGIISKVATKVEQMMEREEMFDRSDFPKVQDAVGQVIDNHIERVTGKQSLLAISEFVRMMLKAAGMTDTDKPIKGIMV